MTARRRPVHVGFLGAGSINRVHAAALSRLDGVELVSVCSRTIQNAQNFRRESAPEARAYDDAERMLEKEELDVLYAAIPPGAHQGEVEVAAGLGIALMLEKPLALTMERAMSIRAAVLRAGVICQIGFQLRHTAAMIHLRRMIDDGSAGRPLFLHARFFTNDLFPTWWRDPGLGGGQLIEQAIHLYDLGRYLFGEARSVTALIDNLAHERFDDYRVDDVSASLIRFRSGGIASIMATNTAAPNAGGIWLTAQFENVEVEFTAPDTSTFLVHGGTVPLEIVGNADAVRRESPAPVLSAYEELSRNFIASVRGEETTRSNVHDGIESLRLVHAAAASASDEGRPVFLEPMRFTRRARCSPAP